MFNLNLEKMRKVKIKKWIPIEYTPIVDGCRKQIKGTGKFDDNFIHSGLFHQWGVSYEEFGEDGTGNYTVAIVELTNGTITEVLPCNIKFID